MSSLIVMFVAGCAMGAGTVGFLDWLRNRRGNE